MNLKRSITKLQNNTANLYLKFEQRFRENGLIRELWSSMAHDISQQIQSLKSLPLSLWNQLKKEQSLISEEVIKRAIGQVNENKEDISIRECFESVLEIEEATILKIYVPIIRSLRKNLTNPALDFYIMVKAHLTRIMREMESFSGDPVLIQRSGLLLKTFEQEVQEPEIVAKPPKKRTLFKKADRKKKAPARQKHLSKRVRPMAKRVKIRHSRTKPLVKKVALQRRRAHR